MLHHVFLSLLVSLLLLAMVWFCQWYRFHQSSFQAKVARHALLPRALKPRSPWIVLHAATLLPARRPRDLVACATLARGEKPEGSTQAGED
jgi:hypothetical protein